MESLHHHLQFLDSSLDPGSALAGTYEPTLVALSVVVASLAAYAALGLAERISAADRPLAKRSWLVVGAVTMGIGVWAMHFLGMLAYRLPVSVNYDVWVTLVSVAPAVLASGIMLHVISQARISPGTLALGGSSWSPSSSRSCSRPRRSTRSSSPAAGPTGVLITTGGPSSEPRS